MVLAIMRAVRCRVGSEDPDSKPMGAVVAGRTITKKGTQVAQVAQYSGGANTLGVCQNLIQRAVRLHVTVEEC